MIKKDKIKVFDIVNVDIKKLKFAEYNPRHISPSQMEKLRASIKEFGFVQPIVINKDMTIIGGHQRILAYQSIGGTQVPAVIVDLSKEKEIVLNLALNRISGEWDQEKLVEILDQIKDGESFPAGSIDLTGFETDEINELIDKLVKAPGNTVAKEMDTEKRLAEIKKPKIQTGDIIKLGQHRMICGNASDIAVISKLFGTARADLIVTSPYDIVVKEESESQYRDHIEYMRKILFNCYQTMNKHRYVCINIGQETKINTSAHISMILEGIGFNFFRNIYWVKPLGTGKNKITMKYPFPRYYDPKTRTDKITIYVNESNGAMPEESEIMVVYDKDSVESNKPEKRNKIPQSLLNAYIGNVWYLQSETAIKSNTPVILPKNCIQFFSLENENIFDPIAMTGSTVIAAEQLNRRAFACEQNPACVQVIAERYQLVTGKNDVTIVRGKDTIKWGDIK